MARSGAGVYSLPAGSTIANGDTSDATDLNVPFADIAADLNVARPIVAGGTGATTAAGALVAFGVTATAAELNALDGITATVAELNILDGVTMTAGQINGLATLPGRNLIINGSGRMNQRSYVSGAATSGANEFTLDRWFVITSGQNLSFTGDASARVMTAPAGGVAQVIEGADIVGGTYVLNWVGTATATVGGTARTKGETFTLTANTNAKVIFSSGTFSNVQLEAGTVTTPFEVVSFGDLLAKCQRYFEFSQFILASSAFGGGISVNTGQWSVKKRATPTLTLFPASGTGATITALGIHAYYQSATHSAVVTGTVQADAELTA